MLVDIALKIWPAPALPEETLAKYQKTKAKVGAVYTLDDHAALKGEVRPLYDELRKRILNLDAGVHEEVRKLYIAYQLTTNFVEIVPLASELKLFLDVTIDELNDPKGLARDVTAVGHWGTGDVEVRLAMFDALDDVMALVRQAFERQSEEGATRGRSGRCRASRRSSSKPAIRACSRRCWRWSTARCATASIRGRPNGA